VTETKLWSIWRQ